MGIGTILGVWLAMRIALATRNSDEADLVQKIISSAFGVVILFIAWINFTMATNTMISSAIALTQLKAETGSISSVAEGYINYVGTTDPATMPMPLGIAFIVVSGLIILGQIWMPKK
jgi:hypothetical protein|tara:strand:+ start:88 stop:438 length:351 start_codon:yes stop_codon:yes gene_type:complete